MLYNNNKIIMIIMIIIIIKTKIIIVIVIIIIIIIIRVLGAFRQSRCSYMLLDSVMVAGYKRLISLPSAVGFP